MMHGLQLRTAGLGGLGLVPGLALITGAPRATFRQLLTLTAQPLELSATYDANYYFNFTVSVIHCQVCVCCFWSRHSHMRHDRLTVPMRMQEDCVYQWCG